MILFDFFCLFLLNVKERKRKIKEILYLSVILLFLKFLKENITFQFKGN